MSRFDHVLQGPMGPWIWLLSPLILAALPHFARAPLWLGPTCIALWLLRLAVLQRPNLIPGKLARLLLTVLCIAGVHASYGYLLGPEPGTALLLLLLALKPLEARSYRDHLVIVLMTYLLVLLHFLVSQSLPAAGYMAVVVLVNTAVLLGLVHPSSQDQPWFRLRQAGVLLAQALPLMLLMFVLFPRLPGSLWGIFQKHEAALTGLSETMSPGDVSRLLQSSEVAFRVNFDDHAPRAGMMYWRALVLWETDGRTWRVGKDDNESEPWAVTPTQVPVSYVLTLEPHGQKWLPVLEMPLTVPDNAQPGPNLRLALAEPLQQRARFVMISSLGYLVDAHALAGPQRRRALALPESGNARSRVRAEQWRQDLPDDQAIVDAALDLFRGSAFVYTLSPPLLGQDAVDEFLFSTRSGYCEHYASAFTFLMRAAGIPARVVLGYQGAERNPLGDYFVIRQYHAHAWSEVWLAGQGWVRVDPTAVLAPDRIEVGAGALVPDIGVPRMFSSREIGWAISLWRTLTHGWDAANALWNQWVLDFGFERQKRFYERLGLADTSRMGRLGYLALGLAGCCLTAGLLYGLMLLRARPRPDPLDALYARFCKRLGRIGIFRQAHEGPLDFAERASRLRPDLAEMIMAVSQTYMRGRYGSESGSVSKRKSDADPARDLGRELARLMRTFRPKAA